MTLTSRLLASQHEDPGYCVTKESWPDLFRYIHAPDRVRKSEAELERDAKALAECPPPPRLFVGKIEGGAEGDIPLAPLQ